MMKKKNESELSSAILIKELDDWISKFVRLKAAGATGLVKCVCCERQRHWSTMDTAHFIPRANMATRFHLANLAPAHPTCNRLEADEHIERWRKLMPEHQLEQLAALSRSMMKFTRIELSSLIEHYKAEVKKLRIEKSL